MPIKEKILFVSICDPTMPKDLTGQKPNCRKHGFMFSPPLKRTLDVFGIHLLTFENP
jgi:hypothetical protein